MNNSTVRQVVRTKISDGRLPRDRVGSIRATNGTGEECGACSLPISSEDVLYKVVRTPSPAFLFHATCFAVWRDERNSMSAGPAVLD